MSASRSGRSVLRERAPQQTVVRTSRLVARFAHLILAHFPKHVAYRCFSLHFGSKHINPCCKASVNWRSVIFMASHVSLLLHSKCIAHCHRTAIKRARRMAGVHILCSSSRGVVRWNPQQFTITNCDDWRGQPSANWLSASFCENSYIPNVFLMCVIPVVLVQ